MSQNFGDREGERDKGERRRWRGEGKETEMKEGKGRREGRREVGRERGRGERDFIPSVF